MISDPRSPAPPARLLPSRRGVLTAGLAAGALAPLVPLAPASATGRAPTPTSTPTVGPAPAGPILKPLPPERFIVHGTNAEMRWDAVRPAERLTPQADLFVRNHTRTPVIDPRTYVLRIHGDGLDRPRAEADAIALRLADLRRLPRRTVTVVHECTGNGRRFFGDQQGRPASGTAWSLGAVGAVRWEGVALRDVLRAVGLSPDAVSVMATGLDDPYVASGVDHGRVRRPIPIAKALDDALLAWGINGEPLLPDHGYPLRLVVPGWVGIASIEWLGSLEVATRELTSPWNTTWYRMTGGSFPSDSAPLTVNPVRSAFELPWDATLSRGRGQGRGRGRGRGGAITLTGRSWSGAAPVRRVEVSVDGGSTWERARIRGNGEPWARWTFDWRTPAPGRHELLARAIDAAGRTQPDEAAWNDGGYFFDAVVRHPVTVA